MTNPIVLFEIYVIGAFISAFLIGAFSYIDSDDYMGGWVMALLWPIVIAAAIVCGIVTVPFWLGTKVRSIFRD